MGQVQVGRGFDFGIRWGLGGYGDSILVWGSWREGGWEVHG